MAFYKFNRAIFPFGVISDEAQSNSGNESYNYSLKRCVNMVINPICGVNKRPGFEKLLTPYSINEQDDLTIVLYKYDVGKEALVIFTTDKIHIFDSETDFSLNYPNGKVLSNEELSNIVTFNVFTTLYFWIEHDQNNNGFWVSLSPIPEETFKFELKLPKFMDPPIVPYKQNNNYALVELTNFNDGVYSIQIKDTSDIAQEEIMIMLVGKYFSFKFITQNIGTEFELKALEGVFYKVLKVTGYDQVNKKLIASNANDADKSVVPYNKKTPDKNWGIGAFTEPEFHDHPPFTGGYLGAPKEAVYYDRRLYLIKDNVMCIGKVGGNPLQFTMGGTTSVSNSDPNRYIQLESDAGAEVYEEDILWIKESIGLVFGTPTGIWILSGTTTGTGVGAVRRAQKVFSGSIANVKPVSTGDSLIFVGGNNTSVYELRLNPQGVFEVKKINKYFEPEIIKFGGIVKLAFQSSPYKILWCILKNGWLASCTIDNEENGIVRGWAHHYIGGRNSIVSNILGGESGLYVHLSREFFNFEEGRLDVKRELCKLSKFNIGLENEECKSNYYDNSLHIEDERLIYDIKNGSIMSLKANLKNFNTIRPFLFDPEYNVCILNILKSGESRCRIDRDSGKVIESFMLRIITDENAILKYVINDVNYNVHVDDIQKLVGARIVLKTNQRMILKNGDNDVVIGVPLDGKDFGFIGAFVFNTQDRVVLARITELSDFLGTEELFRLSNISPRSFIVERLIQGYWMPVQIDLGADQLECDIYLSSNNVIKELTVEPVTLKLEARSITPYEGTYRRLKVLDVNGAFEFNQHSFWINVNDQDNTYKLVSSSQVDGSLLEEYIGNVKFKLIEDASNYGVYNKYIPNNGTVLLYFNSLPLLLIEYLMGSRITYNLNGAEIKPSGDVPPLSLKRPFLLSPDLFNDDMLNIDPGGCSVNIGIPYLTEFEPVSLEGVSYSGSTIGAQGYNIEYHVTVVNSFGGDYATSKFTRDFSFELENKLRPLPYGGKLNLGYEDVKYVTDTLRLNTFAGRETTIRSIYISTYNGYPMNITSIMQTNFVNEGR